MATSSQPSDRDLAQEHSRLRAQQIVEAQMDHWMPHVYVVPEPMVFPAGTGSTILDADGRVVGVAADLLDIRPLDPDSVSWQVTYPEADQQQAEPIDPTGGEPSREQQREWQEALRQQQEPVERWRRHYLDPRAKERVRDALRMRRNRVNKGGPDEKRGRPRKYTDTGALIEFTEPRAQAAQSASNEVGDEEL